MKVGLYGIVGQAVVYVLGLVGPSSAVEVNPGPAQIQAALDRGKHAAALRQAPDRFYSRFGAHDGRHPGGFLITKLGGLSVLASHLALRGLEPSVTEMAQVTESSTMLVSATIFGESPDFAVDSYVILDQGGKMIKPRTVRADGQATRSQTWPESPKFQANVVATFSYIDFDPQAQTTITVFPASGGTINFSLNFAAIE